MALTKVIKDFIKDMENAGYGLGETWLLNEVVEVAMTRMKASTSNLMDYYTKRIPIPNPQSPIPNHFY